jgi:hypothetical protein
MEKPLSDEELVASAKSVAGKQSCKSVIVATGYNHIRPEGRNYFHCDLGTKPHEVHRNGPDSWWLDNNTGEWKFEGGSLMDPYFGGANA